MFRTFVPSKIMLAIASCSLILCGCDAVKNIVNSESNAITGASSQNGSAGYSGIVETDPWQDGYQLLDNTPMTSAPAATPPNNYSYSPADPFANLPTPNLPPNSWGTTPPPNYPSPGFPSPGYTPPGYTPPGYTPPGYTPPGYTPPGLTPPGYPTPGYAPPNRGSGYPSPGYPGPGYSPGGIPPGYPPNRF